jgi:hypothetical protein
MKKIILYLFSIFVGVFVFAGNGWSFRCGADLISTGDTKIKTSMTCGNPTSKEQKCLERHRETGICINKGEAWYYNCGDSDFIYVLTFNEGGALISETTAGRGMGLSDCRGKLAR